MTDVATDGPTGLRRRRVPQAEDSPADPPPPQPATAAAAAAPVNATALLRQLSRAYCTLSILLALLAITAAPTFLVMEEDQPQPTPQHHRLPPWLRWMMPNQDDAKQPPVSAVAALFDPCLMDPSPENVMALVDKVISSTPRLLAICNLLLSMTLQLHSLTAHWFLGHAPTSGLGGFLIFKFLLISTVLPEPDTFDLLILLSWYTILSFLRSLSRQCAHSSQHTAQSGQAPIHGVWQLCWAILLCDTTAAAVCVALFHQAGSGMVLLLTCDCALLAVDVLGTILLHAGQVLEGQHTARLTALEARQEQPSSPSSSSSSSQPQPPQQQRSQRRNEDHEQELQSLETTQLRRMSILDSTVFGLQLFNHLLTVCHFCHIWRLYGVRFTLVDGVIALHLHSALSSASKKITERRNLARIARDMDGMFDDATELDLRKAAAAGDVCCICLGSLVGQVKKVGCGHIYHVSCLREVVERARSIEAARCPLCRASIVDGRHTSGDSNAAPPPAPVPQQAPVQPPQQQAPQGTDMALFRFSTENVLPQWIPLPSFSFEVVRRGPAANNPAAATNNGNNNDSLLRRLLVVAGVMTPEEEEATVTMLADMFPQYDRADLLRELRQRGSAEAVAESIFALQQHARNAAS